MASSVLQPPRVDPTPIFEHFRGSYGSELLTAAVAHFDVFGRLAKRPMSNEDFRNELGLAERPTIVLLTALRAMQLLKEDEAGRLLPTDLAREHLVRSERFEVTGYLGLAAESPGVLEMVHRLRTNAPAGAESEGEGTAFIYREGIESAMEREASARRLTLALAGRARNVAPFLAQHSKLEGARQVLDVGGGTGIYSIALLRKYPQLRAIVLDRPAVLEVAQEMAETYGVTDRLECHAADMFSGPLPEGADVVLLSNVLHDWDVPECRELIGRCAQVLPPGGRLLIHDVFLNENLDGPLSIALYSAALFCLTEGRAYSAAEFRGWLIEAGLEPGETIPTLVHCGILPGLVPHQI